MSGVIELLDADVNKYQGLITQLSSQIGLIKEKIKSNFSKAKAGELPTKEGISLLDVKYHVMLEYMTNLSYFILLKLRNKSTAQHPIIWKLIQLRTYLEKLKPIETKLKYQIDKLIRAASNPTEQKDAEKSSINGPLAFRPNPANLVVDNEENQEVNKDDDQVYRAPKIAPVPFDDRPLSSKAERDQSRIAQKAMRSRLIQDLAQDYDDRPEQAKVIGSYTMAEMDHDIQDRNRFEEENFVRLLPNKKQAKKIKDLQKGLANNELLSLDDFRGVNSIADYADKNKSTNVLSRIQAKRTRANQPTDDYDQPEENGQDGYGNDSFKGLGQKKSKGLFKKAKTNFNKSSKAKRRF